MAFLDKKILIVEDELPLLSSLRDKFEEEGFTVVTAMDGLQGLEAAKNEKPDLVLIDILLPKMDGISMAKEIKKINSGASMIFLTNLSDAEHIAEVSSDFYTDYLIKSDWRIDDVVSKVKEKLALK